MNKSKAGFLIILLILTIGFIPTITFFFNILITLNNDMYTLLNESIFSFLFKHQIAYYIVGLILSGATSLFGIKLGSSISKVLYAIVVIGVAGVFNFLTMIIINIF